VSYESRIVNLVEKDTKKFERETFKDKILRQLEEASQSLDDVASRLVLLHLKKRQLRLSQPIVLRIPMTCLIHQLMMGHLMKLNVRSDHVRLQVVHQKNCRLSLSLIQRFKMCLILQSIWGT
jgi:hypothetical protein